MALTSPTLNELKQRIKADIDSRLPSNAGTKRGDILDTISQVEAGVHYSQRQAIEFYSKQIFPDTAEAEFLDRQLQYRGVFRTPAQKSSGNVEFTGTDGTVIPAGLELKSSSGIKFITTSTAKIASGVAAVSVEAIEAGVAGNLIAGTDLIIVSPVAGLASAKISSGGTSGGAETESDASYRSRGLQVITGEQSLYGKSGDWAIWAISSSPNITRAFEVRNNGNLGYLLVLLANGQVAVGAGDIKTAIDYIKTRAPVGVIWDVASVEIATNNLQVSISPDTSANRSAIELALNNFYRTTKNGQTIVVGDLTRAINSITGITGTLISPTHDITHEITQLPVLGQVNYV